MLAELEQLVGTPSEKMAAIRDKIQSESIRSFRQIEVAFLDLLWTIDSYRVRQLTPRADVDTFGAEGAKLSTANYRGKGNFFSEVISLILSNKTSSPIAARAKVQGFSQQHQIDVAWPARPGTTIHDPLVCCEVKLTGAPGFGDTPDRKGRADWTNRRKELKFQATDLKLFRQQANTRIHNWDQWRRKAPPLVYTIWAARVASSAEYTQMVADAQSLTSTYLDGVGVYGFHENATGTGYVSASVSRGVSERVTSVDHVLDLMAAEINDIMHRHDFQVPMPVMPSALAVESQNYGDEEFR